MTHFHNLADKLRLASGIPLSPGAAAQPPVKLPKSNTQEIIFRWLSPAWYQAKDKNDAAVMNRVHHVANYLREASGIPVE